jgi:NAD(P)-dependent dehydrogenase (short-subunit alcohol dehydrogenase family)
VPNAAFWALIIYPSTK